jgi:hypothetical protein
MPNTRQAPDENTKKSSQQLANSEYVKISQAANIDLKELPEVSKDLIVAQYNSLTTELNSRQNNRYQTMQFSLIALAALLTVSSTSIQSHLDYLIFAYPILVLVFSIIYILNACEGRRIKNYIHTRIEIFLPIIEKEQIGWYGYRQGNKVEKLDSMGNIGAKAVFILTSIFAVLMGLEIIQHQDRINEVLSRVAVGATIILTVLLFIEKSAYDWACKHQWIELPLGNKDASEK